MANWKYRLEFEGQNLRALINEAETLENIVAIYQQLLLCLKHWKDKLKREDREDWEYQIEAMIEDLECACPDIEDQALSYEEEEKNLDYYLQDFYDMCDFARVWIGV